MVTIKHSFTATVVDDRGVLVAEELAHACGAEVEWVVELVEIGLLQAESDASSPAQWRFASSALQCALEARRLQRDFGVGVDAAALIIDLQREIRRLKAVVHSEGIHLR
ncbi:chaperone modulator CbpM [Variovorax dokdonensis]|uniref:Chaperone modulator CbpM n=1 Tax=Variovorax dokdonensis TaxID=344883 RepID=A0ABT7NDD7_9BURK|nr:chaperone modulator CbpM [Variovorax dokdonensis]MDM0045962.1 chaperone modulator CbpM [Variovorax dokdonensis]